MFYAGAQFVTAGHSFRTYGWGRRRQSGQPAPGELQPAEAPSRPPYVRTSAQREQHARRDRQYRHHRLRRSHEPSPRATPSSPTATASSASAPLASEVEACDVVIDAGRTTAIPGLIDSHVHITFGDFTPRQQTVGYLESYCMAG
jgi:hypothetical protein